MTDEELILQYDQKFWELVEDKGYSYRKARRILKKKYPSVYYYAQKDKWFINDHVYHVEDRQMKIRVSDVFDNVNDIRQYMSIGFNDEAKQELAESLGIGTFEVDQVLENTQIYFDGALMNKIIDVDPVE